MNAFLKLTEVTYPDNLGNNGNNGNNGNGVDIYALTVSTTT